MEINSHGLIVKRSEETRARDQKRKMDQTVFSGKYSQEVEEQMKRFYENLSEKEKRRYAALEASKLGHGGQKYICTLLGCSPTTLRVGREEIVHGSTIPKGRIRRPGGGKKRIMKKIENIDGIFSTCEIAPDREDLSSSGFGVLLLREGKADVVVSNRQKHNGMSWSADGSTSLALLTTVRRNSEDRNWLLKHDISFQFNAGTAKPAA